jgi:hypothetical protein
MHDFLAHWLQYFLLPISLTGQLIIGRKLAAGWLVGLGAQALLAVYAIYSVHQFGLLFGTGFYTAVYLLNWYRWTWPSRVARPNRRRGRKMLNAWVLAA